MLQLPNGCTCSEPTISPKNWNRAGAPLSKKWYIQYYFYDPAYKGTTKYPTLKIVKAGINEYHTIAERREAAKLVLGEVLHVLQVDGYNPITGVSMPARDTGVTEFTPFIEALNFGVSKMKLAPATLMDMKSIVKYFTTAAERVRLSGLPVGQVRRKHIRACLDQCEAIKKVWNENQFNHYRAYLSMIFEELVELEACEFNPVKAIKKQRVIKRIRATLTAKQRREVDRHLRRKGLHSFRLFLRIFFTSGARIKELLTLKAGRVDLENQSYIVTVLKRRRPEEVRKTIPDTAIRYWRLLLKNAAPTDYVFGRGLLPGPEQITRPQITRRWEVHVKAELGIDADIYALKHAQSTETTDAHGAGAASGLNSHKSEAMVVKIYDTRREEREHEALKKVRVYFF